MLNTLQLAIDIEAILTDQATRTSDPAAARHDFAQRLATTIETYLHTGRVAGVATVATTGTAAAQTGTATLTNGLLQ